VCFAGLVGSGSGCVLAGRGVRYARVTHVLLPVLALLRRADLAEVIGKALVARACGTGQRPIAAQLGRPPDTVRGWLRRFAERANGLRVLFTLVLVAVSPDPQVPAATGSAVGDAVAAVVAAWMAVVGWWPQIGAVSPWQVASAVTSGGMLAPTMS